VFESGEQIEGDLNPITLEEDGANVGQRAWETVLAPVSGGDEDNGPTPISGLKKPTCHKRIFLAKWIHLAMAHGHALPTAGWIPQRKIGFIGTCGHRPPPGWSLLIWKTKPSTRKIRMDIVQRF